MMNPKAAELWRQYQAETDPQAAEMIYLEYLKALTPSQEPGPRKDDVAAA